MRHEMTLNSPWFELVEQGSKIYEGRRKTQKVMLIREGDTILFHHHTNKDRDPFEVHVVDVLHFSTFRHALECMRDKLSSILPIPEITVDKGDEIYKQYVSLETQQKDGVVMIEICKSKI